MTRKLGATVAPNLVVDADGRLMRIVLDNLIGNAWKFTAHTPKLVAIAERTSATAGVADVMKRNFD